MNSIVSDLRTRWSLVKGALAISMAAPDRAERRRAATTYLTAPEADGGEAARLQADGFAPWALPTTTKNALIAVYRDTEAKRRGTPNKNQSSGKAFFDEALSTDDLKRHPVFLEAALDEQLLRTLIRSSGLVPHLESIDMLISSPAPGPLTASQLWHRDVNDQVILKLFVYLEDVGPENGPFVFIPAGLSSRVPRRGSHYRSDEAVAACVGQSEWREVQGPAGTAFLIDTGNCMHYGSRCQARRAAYVVTYSSGLKFMDRARSWEAIAGERAASLTSLQRLVCGF
ncbi:MAG: phytanoyl-CoA dioxygenase family protein [Caulobacter sp.]|nr:phytanoyl-CoA dioxygenase family protein [Caulobacter sp.]